MRRADSRLVLVCLAACAHSASTDDGEPPLDASAEGTVVDRGEAAAPEASSPDDGGSPDGNDAGREASAAGDSGADAGADASDAAAVDAGLCGAATVLVHRGKDASGARVMTTTGVFPPGFTEEASFRVFPQPSGSDTKPLYQLYSSGYADYLPSQSPTEGNPSYQLTDTIGQMYIAPQPGTIVLTRYVQAAPQKHMASTNPSDVPSTFYAEGPMGYVCPP